MPTKSMIALTAAIVLGAPTASLAKNAGPPSIDIQKTCRESAGALTDLTGNATDNLNSCMGDEQEAHDQLVKNWSTYPALAKSQCVKPKEFLPGYVEWQSCLEMTRDVIKMRRDQAASAPASANASRQSSSRECPIVQTAEDGSVDWVINC